MEQVGEADGWEYVLLQYPNQTPSTAVLYSSNVSPLLARREPAYQGLSSQRLNFSRSLRYGVHYSSDYLPVIQWLLGTLQSSSGYFG